MAYAIRLRRLAFAFCSAKYRLKTSVTASLSERVLSSCGFMWALDTECIAGGMGKPLCSYCVVATKVVR